MRTDPTHAYDTVVQQLMACGLSRNEAIGVLDRHAHEELAQAAHALQGYGIDYALAFGALHAIRGSVGRNRDDRDTASISTLVLIAVLLAGIGYSLDRSAYASAMEYAPSTPLFVRSIYTASVACLAWAALKWLRPWRHVT